MEPRALAPLALLLAGLAVRHLLLVSIQGQRRYATGVFRWPEDAAAFGGKGAAAAQPGDPQPEEERVSRAQAELRNDGENHPYFIASFALWTAAGAPGEQALGAALFYLVARSLHAACMVWPHQPARTRAFVLGQLVHLAVLADAVRRALPG